MTNNDRSPRYSSIALVAADRSLSRSTVNRLIARGEIQAVKLGRRTLVDLQSVDQFFSALPKVPSKPRF